LSWRYFIPSAVILGSLGLTISWLDAQKKKIDIKQHLLGSCGRRALFPPSAPQELFSPLLLQNILILDDFLLTFSSYYETLLCKDEGE